MTLTGNSIVDGIVITATVLGTVGGVCVTMFKIFKSKSNGVCKAGKDEKCADHDKRITVVEQAQTQMLIEISDVKREQRDARQERREDARDVHKKLDAIMRDMNRSGG